LLGQFEGQLNGQRLEGVLRAEILDGIAINEGDLAQFPRFVWANEDASVNRAELARRLLQVAVPALLLAALGAWRLRRYAIV
jgi:hypothetical protein